MSSPLINIDETTLRRASDMVGGVQKDLDTVLARALGRAIVAARTAGLRSVRERYTARQRGLAKALVTRKPQGGELTASISTKGKRSSLYEFKVKPTLPEQRRPRVGARAQVLRQGGGVIPGAFVARMKSGKVGAFIRKGKRSLPIQMLYGPATAQMLSAQDVVESMRDRAGEVMDTRLIHEVDHLMRQKAKKAGLV